MKKHRVVVTGMGVITPIGATVAVFRDRLLAGISGVGPITLFDPASLPTRIAAEAEMPRDVPTHRDRKVAFLLFAAEQALKDATTNDTRPGGGAAGISVGMGLELFSMPDMISYRQPGFQLPESLADRLTFLQTPADLGAHLLSKIHGMHAPPIVHVSACAAGTDAIGTAYRLVATGRRRWMLAGGSDSMINPMGMAGFCKLGAMSRRNDEPTRASRPFDRHRDGFVIGEGAGMLVLETREDALARGAAIHAEIVGYGNSFDAHGISEPHPEGRGAFQAMSRALADAGIEPADLDCVNAHGTSTPKNDPVETLAIKRLLGERAAKTPICSTKSMIGHLIAAAGAVEAIAAIACMQVGQVHPTINLEEPDPACDLDYVPGRSRLHPQRYALSNSFGFGGQNASLVLHLPSPVD
ncbi:MAG: beta-ketoacyl-[acyl-carrier-protein] synthase family protein [Pseudomonadota bacterium]